MFSFNISPLVRISFGLTMLTATILMLANYLGLIPNTDIKELEHRQWITESLATAYSNSTDVHNSDKNEALLDRAIESNTTLLSGALRTLNGELVIVSGPHQYNWNNSELNFKSNQIEVALLGIEGQWGTLELVFQSTSDNPKLLISQGSTAALIGFTVIFGFLSYMLFLKKVVQELNSDDVLPDRVSTAFDTLAEGIVIIEPKGYIVFSNSPFNKLIGQAGNDIVGKKITNFKWQHSSDNTSLDRYPWEHVLDTSKALRGAPVKLNNRHGKLIPLTVNATPIIQNETELQGVLVSFDDLSEIEASNEQLSSALARLEETQKEVTEQNRKLHILATRDPMTNALNRRSFFEGANLLINTAKAGDQSLCIMMVDIDHFKSVNDQYGHGIGDKVIIFLYACLAKHARQFDLVARFGGEEFCVAMPSTSIKDCERIAEQMRISVQDDQGHEYPEELKITASFGVTCLTHSNDDIESLIEEADLALYDSKENGRNRVTNFTKQHEIECNAKISTTPTNHSKSEKEHFSTPVNDSILSSPTLKDDVSLDSTTDRIITSVTKEETKHLDDLLLLDRIEQAAIRSKRYSTQLAVVSIDIELLQRINDTLGPAVGKKMADAINLRMDISLRDTDSILAQNNDNSSYNISNLSHRGLVLILTDIHDSQSLVNLIERVIKDNAKPLIIEGIEYLYNTNMGISVFPKDGDDAHSLLRSANIAKAEAMSSYKNNNYCYFSSSLGDQSKKRLSLEAELYRSIERDELVLFYQPKASLKTGLLTGFEALIRWEHPLRGTISPDEFIPIAESSGLIVDLGRWVIESACKQIIEWQDKGFGDIPISINLSPIELESYNLADSIIQSINRYSLDPLLLEVEFTESNSVKEAATIVEALKKLSNAGVKITIDDFGTGYASLGYLQNLPVNKIKVDRTFISSLATLSNDSAIVSAVISMGQTLDLIVIAEGVENKEQLQYLQEMNCDEVQGYYVSKPLKGENTIDFIQDSMRLRNLINPVLNASDDNLQPLNALFSVLNDSNNLPDTKFSNSPFKKAS